MCSLASLSSNLLLKPTKLSFISFLPFSISFTEFLVHRHERSSISFCDFENTSRSMSSIFTYGVTKDKPINSEARTNIKKVRFSRLSRVKKATRCIAKKINQIFIRAKMQLIIQLRKHTLNSSVSSTNVMQNELEPFRTDKANEPKVVYLTEITELSSRCVMLMKDWKCQSVQLHHLSSPNSFDSIPKLDSSFADSSFSSETSDSMSIIQRKIADSMADFHQICAQAEQKPVKSCAVPKIIRQGTPYKMNMTKSWTLYNECFDSL